MAVRKLNGGATSGCRLCGAAAVAGTSYCTDCGRSLRAPPAAVGAVSPPAWIAPSISGTRCRGCGRASEVTARYCGSCGTALSRSAAARSRVSGSAATLAAIPLLQPVLEDLDGLLDDGHTTLLVLVERSSTDLIDACDAHFEKDRDVVWRVAAHPSRARVPYWECREILRLIERDLTEKGADPNLASRAARLCERLVDDRGADFDALVEAFLEVVVEYMPSARPTVIVDRAHRCSRASSRLLAELARLAAIRVLFRAPMALGDATVERPGAVLTHPLAARPPSASVSEEIASLPDASSEVLRAAATLGWGTTRAALEELLEGRLSQGIDRVRALGILEVEEDEVRFVDPDLADWIRAGLSPTDRDRWSCAALSWEASRDAPVEVRAEHAAGIADLPTAALLFDVAGRRALERGDVALAIEHLSRAVARVRAADQLEPDAATCRTGAQLGRKLAEILLREGEHATAEGVLREALDRPLLELQDKAALTVLVAAVAMGRGHHGEARRVLEEAVRVADHAKAAAVALDARLWHVIVSEAEGVAARDVSDLVVAAFESARGVKPSRQAPDLLTTVVRKLVERGERQCALSMLEGVARSTDAFDAHIDKLQDALLERS